MFMEPNWKQLRRVGSQATPSWTTALLFVGGLACQGPIALPSLGPRSHPATRILHERRTPHPHAGPPRPAPSSLLRAPETALRAHRVSFKQHKERLPTQSNLRRGRSEHRRMPEVKMDKVWPHPCKEVKTAIICRAPTPCQPKRAHRLRGSRADTAADRRCWDRTGSRAPKPSSFSRPRSSQSSKVLLVDSAEQTVPLLWGQAPTSRARCLSCTLLASCP